MPTNDCGCVEENDTIYACQLHSDVMMVQMALSHRGFCGACCDTPMMRREVERVGEDRIREAIAVLPDSYRDYAVEIFEEATVDRASS